MAKATNPKTKTSKTRTSSLKKVKKAAATAPKRGANPQSPELFAQLVNDHSAAGKGLFPLTNFTFFLGAGFSKSWATSYPVGTELFQASSAERMQLTHVERAANFSGVSPSGGLTMDDIKQIIYSLDMNARYPAIRSRYVDDQNISAVKRELSAYFCTKFQKIVGNDWYWFDKSTQKFSLPPLQPHQAKIQGLFNKMFKLIDGSQGILEGARFNFLTTNYDWLVEAIIDSVCDSDDSAFLYLYRGVTPREVSGFDTPVVAHAHWLVFNLLKINGGFEIFPDGAEYHFDYTTKSAADYMSRPPVLMFPSREQDYMSAYFNAVFPKAVRLLHESKVLILVGYSLPEEDALLRFIVRQFCEDEADAPEKFIFYVDMADEPTQMDRLRSLFPFAGTTLRVATYSGSFANWAGDVVARLR